MFKAIYIDENKARGSLDNFDAEKIKPLLNNKKSLMWIDIQDPNDEDIDFLLEIMQFHPLTVEDCLILQQHAKVAFFDEYIFLTIHSMTSAINNFEISQTSYELDLYLGKNYLITIHEEPIKMLQDLFINEKDKPLNSNLSKGVDFTLYILLDKFIDGYFPVIENYNKLFEILDDRIFKEADPILMSKILKAKKSILSIRKILGPLRTVVSQLMHTNSTFIKVKTLVYYRDVYDHVMLLYDMVENYRDMLNTVMEAHLANTSNRLNEIMKTLTLVATIMMPLTLVTSFYGMNVKAPEFEWGRTGYFFVWIVLIVSLLLMLLYFKRRKLF